MVNNMEEESLKKKISLVRECGKTAKESDGLTKKNKMVISKDQKKPKRINIRLNNNLKLRNKKN